MINPEARHDPKDVVSWGRAAAMLYLNNEVPLCQSVCDIVKDKSVTTEHIQRILEVANITAYLAEYDRIEGPSKIVNFPGGPATLASVLACLNEEDEGDAMPHEDYDEAPKDYKAEKVAAHLEHFDGGQFEKTASAVEELSELDQIKVAYEKSDDLSDLFFKMDAAVNQLEEEIIKLSAAQYDLEQDLGAMLKEAASSGYSLGDIRRAASEATDPALDNMLVKTANKMVHLFPTEPDVVSSMQKVSGDKIVNPEHPLRTTFSSYRQVLDAIKTKTASIEVLKGHQEDIVRKKSRA
jgi:hypothetical protein